MQNRIITIMMSLRIFILLMLIPVIVLAGETRETDKLPIYEIVQPDGHFGTGFMIEDSILGQMLVTNRHIIQDSKGHYFDKIFVRNNRLLKTKQVISDTLGFYVYLIDKDKKGDERYLFYSHPDPNIDLAIIPIIHPDQQISTRKPLYGFDSKMVLSRQGLDSLGVEEGTDVEIIGFSLTNSLFIDDINYHFSRFGKIGLYTSNDFELSIDGTPRQANFVLLSMLVKNGDSGSPIIAHINGNLYIAGIVTAVVPDFEFGVGYPSYYITDFLDTIRTAEMKKNAMVGRR